MNIKKTILWASAFLVSAHYHANAAAAEKLASSPSVILMQTAKFNVYGIDHQYVEIQEENKRAYVVYDAALQTMNQIQNEQNIEGYLNKRDILNKQKAMYENELMIFDRKYNSQEEALIQNDIKKLESDIRVKESEMDNIIMYGDRSWYMKEQYYAIIAKLGGEFSEMKGHLNKLKEKTKNCREKILANKKSVEFELKQNTAPLHVSEYCEMKKIKETYQAYFNATDRKSVV